MTPIIIHLSIKQINNKFRLNINLISKIKDSRLSEASLDIDISIVNQIKHSILLSIKLNCIWI